MSEASDKRSGSQRARIDLDVDLSTYGKYFLLKLLNVSIGGAFVCSEKLHPIGTELKIRFKLPQDSAPIEAEGKVVWTYTQPDSTASPNASGMGVQFTKIAQEDQNRIAGFIERQTQP